ncbi:tetraspanin-7b [Tachysurus fulvidraco]|uniref:tetraspanin-7b n=1 Tax=Tachysurus fulvidraco TaxID=1234273 RepID=UPI001FED887C|nr:tetraspanin-7b [Tachysurus fulvidraco]
MASRRMETKPVITCLKTLLIVYSFVFWITGAILLAVGLWGKFMLGPYISLIAENSTNAPYVLIGTGTTIIVFGLFGCFATCRGSPWMLKLVRTWSTFSELRSPLILDARAQREQGSAAGESAKEREDARRGSETKRHLSRASGISGFVFRHEIKGTFLRTYNEAVLNYNAQDERSLAVDNVQRSLRCCGVLNYTSWFNSVYYPTNGIPPSCCANVSDCNLSDLRNVTIATGKVHQQGCYELVTSFIETNMGIIAGVTFGIAFSQLIGMLLACCLSRFITANQYEMV